MRDDTMNPYIRTIRSVNDAKSIEVDVYNVLEAFRVTSPPIQHAIKKLLCAGLRGSKPVVQDLRESIQAIERAIVMKGGEPDA